jgi:hypothetical protein
MGVKKPNDFKPLRTSPLLRRQLVGGFDQKPVTLIALVRVPAWNRLGHNSLFAVHFSQQHTATFARIRPDSVLNYDFPGLLLDPDHEPYSF